MPFNTSTPADYNELNSLRDWVRWGASVFNHAGLFYGHGTDNALDEALLLVLHAVHLDHSLPSEFLDTRLTHQEKQRIMAIFEQRIDSRVPAAYITGKASFAGLDFHVNTDVLVPRSPIAELILQGFSPWLDQQPVSKVLDLCCGSGCIGIACAYAFPDADVDLLDISTAALAVAEKNIALHQLSERVTTLASDVFDKLAPQMSYDLIVSNPPYVSYAEMATLPEEYLKEPKLGLEAGEDGMDTVQKILSDAHKHLNPGGIIVVEVGDSVGLLLEKYPGVPFLWPEFESGGHGVFILTAEQLTEYQSIFVEE